MFATMVKLLQTFRKSKWFPILVACLGAFYYLFQGFHYVYEGKPILDEGLYVYKGWLYLSGQYTPYQPNGPYLNHAPFAFLIPGLIQTWLGPGLLSARMFMLFLGVIMLLGMWLVSRRFGGDWGGGIGVWGMAILPSQIHLYSRGLSQLLIATCIVWIMVLILGKERSWKELFFAAGISALMVLIRENMILAVPFIGTYVLFQHGWRPMVLGGFIFLLIVILVHLFYWPGILIIWAPWIPFDLTFLGYIESGGARDLSPKPWGFDWNHMGSRTLLFFQGIPDNLITVLGMLLAFLGWPKNGLEEHIRKISVFLLAMMLALFVAHAWASVGKNYCPSCLNFYIPFFSPVGILLIVLLVMNFYKSQPSIPGWVTSIVLVIFSASVGLGTFEKTGFPIMNIPVMIGGREEPVFLWQIISNKFHMDSWTLRRMLPLLVGLLVGLTSVILGVLLYRLKKFTSFSYAVMSVFLVAGALYPIYEKTLGAPGNQGCEENIIQAYEDVGEELREIIPAGSIIYWAGYSPVTLLYMSSVEIFPPQLNLRYSFKDSISLERARLYGFWNTELGQAWLEKSDYVLFQDGADRNVQTWMGDEFEEVDIQGMVNTCYGNVEMRIFRRK